MITLKIHKHYTSNDLLSVLEARRTGEVTVPSETDKRQDDLKQPVEVDIP